MSESNLLEAIIKKKREVAEHEDLLKFLQMENSQYALEINHMENIISNIQTILKKIPANLVQGSDNIYKILQLCNNSENGEPSTSLDTSTNEKKFLNIVKTTPVKEKTPSHNKAHIVKPHMVNGHILYIPTINLTRVSDMRIQSTTPNTSQQQTENNSERCVNEDVAGPSTSRFTENSSEIDSEDNQFNDENQITRVENITEASTSSAKSPSHSTVLSGTFQEVKIYLNQVSPESLNEESRKKLSKKSQKAKNSKKRGSTSFDHVTKRRKT